MAKPEGVRIERADGTVLPVELVHVGVDERGTDQWEIAGVVYQQGDRVHMDVFPAHTGIRFAVEYPEQQDESHIGEENT